jgi:2-amino-4-hydroxy-6-hydroxymethyldihydropteridine diphosphokinase
MIPKSGNRSLAKIMRTSDVSDNAKSATEHQAFIALGGNVGDARATLDRAVAMFCDGAAVRLLARSSDYRTPPWGVEDQPAFVNLCLMVATGLSPRDLLARAHEVERAFGRDRANERRWGPRPVDIDLLAYDDVTLDDRDLILPHPRLLERAFVLVPLAEIAAERRIAGVRVADALARLDTAGIERLTPRASSPLSG